MRKHIRENKQFGTWASVVNTKHCGDCGSNWETSFFLLAFSTWEICDDDHEKMGFFFEPRTPTTCFEKKKSFPQVYLVVGRYVRGAAPNVIRLTLLRSHRRGRFWSSGSAATIWLGRVLADELPSCAGPVPYQKEDKRRVRQRQDTQGRKEKGIKSEIK